MAHDRTERLGFSQRGIEQDNVPGTTLLYDAELRDWIEINIATQQQIDTSATRCSLVIVHLSTAMIVSFHVTSQGYTTPRGMADKRLPISRTDLFSRSDELTFSDVELKATRHCEQNEMTVVAGSVAFLMRKKRKKKEESKGKRAGFALYTAGLSLGLMVGPCLHSDLHYAA